MQPVCGALDYVDGFGVALGGDVHAWLLQRAEQLCSPECRDEWNLLVGTQRVPGECGVFDQLMARAALLPKQGPQFTAFVYSVKGSR
jgi:hypothetical protein